MSFIPNLALGPFETNEALWEAVRKIGHPPLDAQEIEELFRYDGTQISIIQTQDKQIWLSSVVEDAAAIAENPLRRQTITHYLPFANETLLRATLHGSAPTTATYVAASGPIVVTTFSYNLEDRRSSAFRFESATCSVIDIPENQMPYAHLRPGNVEVYGPFEDPWSEQAEIALSRRLTPGADDIVLVNMDGARNWVRLKPGYIHEAELIVCIRDDQYGYIQHRLFFKHPEAFGKTLAAGVAPTMDTYRLADKIERESIAEMTEGPSFITIEALHADTLGNEAPTFLNVAEHDAAWPQFAKPAPAFGAKQ